MTLNTFLCICWAFVCHLWKKISSVPLAIFEMDWFLFRCWVVLALLHILDVNILPKIWFANTSYYSLDYLFISWIILFTVQKFFHLIKSYLLILFSLYYYYFGDVYFTFKICSWSLHFLPSLLLPLVCAVISHLVSAVAFYRLS